MERSINFSSLNFIGQFGLSNCMFGLPQPPDFFLHPVQRFLTHLVVMDVESDPGHGNFHSAVLTNIGVTVYSSAESVTNNSLSLSKICIFSNPYTLFNQIINLKSNHIDASPDFAYTDIQTHFSKCRYVTIIFLQNFYFQGHKNTKIIYNTLLITFEKAVRTHLR